MLQNSVDNLRLLCYDADVPKRTCCTGGNKTRRGLLYGCAALADVGEFMMQLEKQSHLVELKECRTSAPGLMVSALLRLLAPLC